MHWWFQSNDSGILSQVLPSLEEKYKVIVFASFFFYLFNILFIELTGYFIIRFNGYSLQAFWGF